MNTDKNLGITVEWNVFWTQWGSSTYRLLRFGKQVKCFILNLNLIRDDCRLSQIPSLFSRDCYDFLKLEWGEKAVVGPHCPSFPFCCFSAHLRIVCLSWCCRLLRFLFVFHLFIVNSIKLSSAGFLDVIFLCRIEWLSSGRESYPN